MTRITALWRHPIKAHGREALAHTTLIAGQAMPFDRIWAVTHDAAKVKDGDWAPCGNFNRGAKIAGLMAITAKLDEVTELVTLSHPDLPDLTAHPDRDAYAIINWAAPLCDPGRSRPKGILRLDGRGYTDTPFASISICNTASHAAVESLAMAPLQPARWRGNIWVEGSTPWEEFAWVGRDARIGTARLRIEERITRCKATTVNTDTGARDVDTLAALRVLDHQDFGVYATVIESGSIAVGDRLELI